jgi:chorismate mutase/prephenate dehydratase
MSNRPGHPDTKDPEPPAKEPAQASQDPVPDLGDLRRRINEVDSQLLNLFTERMALARDVARFKAKSGAAVYDPLREDEVAASAREKIAGPDGVRAEMLLRSLMRLSRGVQYDQLMPIDAGFRLGAYIRSALPVLPAPGKIVYQGSAGAYSSLACARLFPGRPASRVMTFAEACRQVDEGEAEVAVLPLENTSAGTVDDVYDLLQRYDLHIWRSLSLPIHHRLLGLPGSRLEDIRAVISHPQALAQCSDLIRRQGWEVRESLNTAFAAEAVTRSGDPSLAAIASAEAGLTHGLVIISESVSNASNNQTRFIVIGKALVISPDASRLSLVLSLPHRSGALTSTLAIFSDRNLNLSKIQSRPDSEHPWSYVFHLDVDCPAHDPQAMAAMYQLSREMPYLQLLGWYNEEGADIDA